MWLDSPRLNCYTPRRRQRELGYDYRALTDHVPAAMEWYRDVDG